MIHHLPDLTYFQKAMKLRRSSRRDQLTDVPGLHPRLIIGEVEIWTQLSCVGETYAFPQSCTLLFLFGATRTGILVIACVLSTYDHWPGENVGQTIQIFLFNNVLVSHTINMTGK